MTTVSAIIPVYQDRDGVSRTVEALIACGMDGVSLDIIVVDDGSTDGVAEQLREKFGLSVRVLRHVRNQGRSAARNSGMAAARGDFLLFLDADCVPQSGSFILAHLTVAKRGACSIGVLRNKQVGFWDRYQDQGAKLKEARSAPLSLTFTSANFMIPAGPIRAVGGFDESYLGYGFEDRDLALRLAASGQELRRNSKAVVSHDDELTLGKVCQKMEDAGRLTSTRFSLLHPAAYVEMGYGRLDIRLNPWLRVIHGLTEWARPELIRKSDRLVESPLLPFMLTSAWAKILVALSYLHGTVNAAKSLR